MKKIIGTFLLSSLGLVTPAFADDFKVLQNYDQAYFAEFAPFTALDMLDRVPGFQSQSGQTERGMGQGGANVLLNGQLLVGKGDEAFNQLSRINAKNVIRIEIIDGSSLDIPGLTGQVANIVTEASEIKGNWEWKPEWRARQKAALGTLKATITGTEGDLAYSASIGNLANRNGHWGPETQMAPDGTVLRTLDERATYHRDILTGSVDLTWTPDEDRVGHLNLEFNHQNYNQAQLSIINPVNDNSLDGEDQFSFGRDQWTAQIDGDYEFPFADGRLKLIGYYKEIHTPTEARFLNYAPTGPIRSHIEYHQDSDEAELIGRTEYSWSPKDGRDWELGLEGAFNYLDLNAELFNLISGPEPIDTVSSRVEEFRTEATLTHTRRLSSKWNLQFSMGGEYSEISQGNFVREFWRPKGFISTTYQPNSETTWRTRVERKVGQLDFFDFIASVDLQENQNTAGNAELVPEQSWRAEAEYEKRLEAGHTFSAKVFAQSITDVVDRIPVFENGVIISDSVGNIDDTAHRYGVEINSTINGSLFGLKGAELRAALQLSETSLKDPLTREDRSFNGETSNYWEIKFRHDIQNTELAWGFEIFDQRIQPVYSFDRIVDYDYYGTWGSLFAEHKSVLGLKVRAELQNLFGFRDRTSRFLYMGSRQDGTLSLLEDQSRESGLYFRLEVTGNF